MELRVIYCSASDREVRVLTAPSAAAVAEARTGVAGRAR